jgi:hypothetical protein
MVDINIQVVAGTGLALVVGIYLLDYFFANFHDPREPVHIRPGIPLIGHMLGMVREGSRYLATVSQADIFTLPIFSFKMYIVADRSLHGPIQRAAKFISFTPFIKDFHKAFAKLTKERIALHDDPRFIHEFKEIAVRALMPGKGLDELSYLTAKEKLRMMDEMAKEVVSAPGDDPVVVDLNEWVQHIMTLAPSTGLYGEANPYKDPAHEKALW